VDLRADALRRAGFFEVFFFDGLTEFLLQTFQSV